VREQLIPILELVGRALAWPLVLAWRARLVSYQTAGQILSLVPGEAGVFIRRGWYRLTLASCGRRLTVEFGSVISRCESRIGDDGYVGEFNHIGLVDIGADFMASDRVEILSGMHHYGYARRDVPMRAQPGRHERVTIGEDVWIGVGAVVGADVAAHSVVGSGSVVTRTFAEWQILGGVPAAPIGERP
jgi:virginiamycin A acetyltransferase